MITNLIFDWAIRTPDRTAVIYNGHPWSYRSFAQIISVARGYFARRGYIGPGYAVLAIPNLINFWVLSLALRSLGLTTIGVPSATAVRNLSLPDVRCVITGTSPRETYAGLGDLCTELGLPLLSVSLDGERALGLDASEAPDSSGGHILMTSGTTGTHKMILWSSTFDAVSLRRRVKMFGLNQDTVFCVFDFWPWTGPGYRWTVSPWTVGGATLIEQSSQPYKALLRPGITHAILAPALLSGILAAPTDAFPRSDAMQLAVTAGALSQTQIDLAKVRITSRLFNSLASTETGHIAFTPLETPEDRLWHRLIPGRLTEIVDEADRPVSIGEIGRLRVSTAGGPTSYLNNEAATRIFFKNDFFYTGDLAVMRSDGRMALQGRISDVINVQGNKVSPAPIEDRLSESLGVSGVCLFSTPDNDGEEVIHLVIESPTPYNSERLIAALNQEFGGGFHRACVHCVATLPRNQMGKVMRQATRSKVIGSQPRFARAD
jgi:acyl-coenzyme A synthetase/AMP-(fatty) acid ligase